MSTHVYDHVKLLIAVTLISLCAAAVTHAQTAVGSHCTDSSCYTAVSKTHIDYNVDQADCQARGGDYATIADEEENNAVVSATNFCPVSRRGFVEAIIGLNDIQSEGNFVWVDGSPLVYTNWRSGEPNNSGDQDLGEIRSSGYWDDTKPGKSGTPRCYICELSIPWQPSVGGIAGAPSNALVSEGTHICRRRAPASGRWIPGRLADGGCATSHSDDHIFADQYEVLTVPGGTSSFGWQAWTGIAPSNAMWVDFFNANGVKRLICRVPGVGPGTLTPGNSCRVRKLPLPGGGLHETHSGFEIMVFNP